jgi:outer membrane protein TolC
MATHCARSRSIARAVKHNQDIRVEEFTIELANAQSRVQSAEMLPRIVAESQFFGRDVAALTKSNLSSTYSTSTDLNNLTGNASFSWSIIDFGLSYVRAQQAGDKALFQIEQRRKVVQRVVEETRTAFWRAIVYERIVERMKAIDGEVQEIERLAHAQAVDGVIDPLAALSYQRDILTLRRELDSMRSSLTGAPEQLRQLINFPQGERLRLKAEFPKPPSELIKLDPETAIHTALENRYEIRQLMYDMRINDKEVTATLLQLLPGVGLTPSLAGDTSSYLMNPTWTSLGVRASWNLINLFKYPTTYRAIQAKSLMDHAKAVATATAIAAQVYIGRTRYMQMTSLSKSASKYLDVQRAITNQIDAAARIGRLSGQALVRERLSDILAQARRDLAYADVQSAYASYVSTLGLDVLDYGQLQFATIEEIASYLRQADAESRKALDVGRRPEGDKLADGKPSNGKFNAGKSANAKSTYSKSVNRKSVVGKSGVRSNV